MKISTPIILVVTTLVVLVGAYWYFFVGSGNQQPLTPSATIADPAQTRFQTLVSELRSISFDTLIFSDARFNTLVDITTPITPEVSGRTDPFAPVTKASIATTSAIKP